MKRISLLILLCGIVSAGVFGQVSSSGTSPKVLFIYEEENENIDPWLEDLRTAFEGKNITYTETAAAGAQGMDLDSYDLIYIHGAVMAFTAKEPVRDWLETSPDLSGRRIVLTVTANRWFLDKYTQQLTSLLEAGYANVIDTISSATKDLSEEEKEKLIKRQLEHINGL